MQKKDASDETSIILKMNIDSYLLPPALPLDSPPELLWLCCGAALLCCICGAALLCVASGLGEALLVLVFLGAEDVVLDGEVACLTGAFALVSLCELVALTEELWFRTGVDVVVLAGLAVFLVSEEIFLTGFVVFLVPEKLELLVSEPLFLTEFAVFRVPATPEFLVEVVLLEPWFLVCTSSCLFETLFRCAKERLGYCLA